MKTKALLIITLLLVLPLAAALPEVIIDIVDEDNSIEYDGLATFTIEITNNQNTPDRINIDLPQTDWSINTKSFLDLGAHEAENITILISPPQNVKSGKYSIYLGFKNMNGTELSNYQYVHVKVKDSAPQVTTIGHGKVDIQIEATDNFLSTNYKVTITNIGRERVEDTFTTTFSDFEKLFVQSTPKQSDIEENTYYWVYGLDAGESTIINYSVSYLPLLIAGILFGIAIILFGGFYVTKLSVLKEIRVSKGKGDKIIKIRLTLKNNSYNEQRDIILQDVIPAPLKVTRDDFGSRRPSAVKRIRNKTVLIWKFNKLEPKDEIVLSYGMKSSMEVIGKVTLPPSMASQKKGKKTTRTFSKVVVK